jgi:hypothetical protein
MPRLHSGIQPAPLYLGASPASQEKKIRSLKKIEDTLAYASDNWLTPETPQSQDYPNHG